ncbi:MAG: ABC transporter ATP-binding protein [Actinomycetota bacterium]
MDSTSLFRRGMRVIATTVRLSPVTFAVSVTGAAVFAAGTVVSTIVLGRITDDVVLPAFEEGEMPLSSVGWAVVAVAAITVIRAAGVVARRYYAGMTAERAQMHLRSDVLDRYLSLPLQWHRSRPAGRLLAHADNDIDVTTEVIHPLPFSLGAGFLAVFSAAALLVVDPVIAVVAFAIFPTLTLINRVYSSLIETPAAEVQEGVGRVSSIAHESFDGALVVKALGRGEAENARFAEAAHHLQGRRRRVGYLRAVFESALDSLPNLGMVLVVALGAWRIQRGAMTQGDLVQVAALFSVLAMPMRVFGFFLEMVPPSTVAFARVTSVLDTTPAPTATGGHRLPDGPLAVEARDLTFGYGAAAPVLRNVEVAIPPGEVTALVGSTGSGKTTLCTLLAGLLPPSAGHVTIGGLDIDTVGPDERTDAIAFVFQEAFLFADTLRSNVLLRDGAGEDELARVLAVAQVDRFLDDLPNGVDTVLGERGVTLSGGQRQRVALARALVRRPRFLLLDDATSAVDAVVEQEILDGLRSTLAATTLIVAQRLSTIELADRVLYLADGRIAASGTHAELLADPGYEALVRAYEEAAV